MNSESPDVRITSLRPGAGRPLLVVDFNEFTARTTLSAVLAQSDVERPVLRLDAVNGPTMVADRSLVELAEACAAELRRRGQSPEAVLGYCSAAPLALHIVDRLEAAGSPRPRLILVEPTWMTPELVRADVAALQEKLAGAPVDGYHGELSVPAIAARLQEALAGKLRADELPEDEIEFCVPHLTDRYRSWFRFLLGTLDAPLPAGLLPDAVVIGEDGGRFPHPSWPAEVVRVERLPLPTGSVLGDAGTGALLTRLLAQPSAAGVFSVVGPPAAGDGARMTDLLERSFADHPDELAVSDERESLTYRELEERARAVAVRLRELGVGPDAPVALLAERSAALAVAIVAVLLADGAYLPLDPTWPAARVEYVLEQAAPRALLCDPKAAPAAGSCPQVPVLALDGAALDGAALDGAVPRAGAGAVGAPSARGAEDGDLAYVIYTSGSTGRPKGVGVPHRGLVNRLRWMQERFPIGVGDAVLQKTPYTFDVSVWEFLWPLSAGARLVMARPDGHRDPEYLAETIRRESISVVHFVPSMLDLFLACVEPRSCPSLRHVFASGEALSPGTANRFLAGHDAPLHNLYGPTEASIDVTHWTCRNPEPGTTVPIGRPIRGVGLSVRDEAGRPVAAGEIGELYLGGVCLARGYLGQPELTATSFAPDVDGSGERLYRTGDLVRLGEDGVVEFHGRRDHQVKIRGLRIELGEIESVAREHPAVAAAVAVARREESGDPRLVLYLTPELDAGTAVAVRRHLASRLPEQCVPSAVVPLAALPLTANGKCDRAALPAPTYTGLGRGATRRRKAPTPK
ncbi:amino acid adenylation domain-containing protein [Streptacidiphilus jiangxiensis]|uniref:Amino acid adenylation domain-containing protein n=1 Tax=Streptacidiphilus jiangxiensis TaxID=235985 RepID=A0A1H7VM48_STRJI|nr:amino acid adenylation domain-containing protein [Streptacidiphilus jiangxiensis]SEM10316.1 amino acid adenylation domain-containing protein [Streptacidiphilus jiangxiensis]